MAITTRGSSGWELLKKNSAWDYVKEGESEESNAADWVRKDNGTQSGMILVRDLRGPKLDDIQWTVLGNAESGKAVKEKQHFSGKLCTERTHKTTFRLKVEESWHRLIVDSQENIQKTSRQSRKGEFALWYPSLAPRTNCTADEIQSCGHSGYKIRK